MSNYGYDGIDSLNDRRSTSIANNSRMYDAKRPVNNITTARVNTVLSKLGSAAPSKNMADANMKSLRLFRRICRLLPMVIHMQQLKNRVNLEKGKQNVAKHFRAMSHLRDPRVVDAYVVRGYSILHEAEHKYSDWHHFEQFLRPKGVMRGDVGISYLDEKMYEKKSDFLKGFYKGKGPNF